MVNEMFEFAKRTMKLYEVLENDMRKKIWDYIQKKPRNITEIQKHLDIAYKNVLNHLDKLESYGFIEREKLTNTKGRVVLIKPIMTRQKFFNTIEKDFQKSLGKFKKKSKIK